MKYRVREHSDGTAIVDDLGRSIVKVVCHPDPLSDDGSHYSVARFEHDIAQRIVKALDLLDALERVSTKES